MIDKIVDKTLQSVFSLPCFGLHIIFCVAQFVLHIDVNIITNVISWEAIFLALLIGIQQFRHHEVVQDHLKKGKK